MEKLTVFIAKRIRTMDTGRPIAEAVAVADGRIKVDPIISAVADLKDGASWFRRLHENTEGLLKVILRP